MGIVRKQYGDIHILFDGDLGYWIFAAGPAFPSGDMLMPYEGAVFFRTDLRAYYAWHNEAWVFISSGGVPVPAGTGFRHVVAGLEDAAAKLVENADVAAAAAIVESKLALNFATHSNANDPTADQKAALAGTSGVPSVANKYVTDADARNTNARTPTAHATSHQNAGGDEITVLGLSGLLADPQTPLPHAASHQNAGSDEISVLGLSGLLADPQTPLVHDIITAHNGFPGGTSNFLRADGTFAAPVPTPFGLTKIDDTNVTVTLAGTPTTALLQPVQLILGWTGTLADARIASAATWNAKVGPTRTINTTAPLAGGGDLSADRTLSIAITPANPGGAVALQAATPGTQQTGHLNISGTGKLGYLGVNADPSYRVHIADATTNGRGLYVTQTSANAGYAFGIESHASGAATTNVAGYFIASGATNNFGVWIGGPAAGANNYALYSEATAQSYFAGSVGIGGTPDEKLTVAGWLHFTTASQGIKFQDGTTQITAPAAGSGLTGGGAANRVAFWTTAANLSYDNALIWDNTNKLLGLGIAPTQLFHAQKDQNAATIGLLKNATAGTSASCSWRVVNDLGTIFQIGQYSSTTSAYGAIAAGDGMVYGSGSFTLMADAAGGIIKFATGGNTERARLTSGGLFGIGRTPTAAHLEVLTDLRVVDASANYFQIEEASGATNFYSSSVSQWYFKETTGSIYSPGTVISNRMFNVVVSPPSNAPGACIALQAQFDSRAIATDVNNIGSWGAWLVNLGPSSRTGVTYSATVGMEINTLEIAGDLGYTDNPGVDAGTVRGTVGLQIVPESELSLWGATRHGYNGSIGLYLSRSVGVEDGTGRTFAGAKWNIGAFIGKDAITAAGAGVVVHGASAVGNAPEYILKGAAGTYWKNGITLLGTFTNIPLDLNGGIATRVRALSLSNGDNHNLALGAHGFQRITGPTGVFSITGLAGGVDGRIVMLLNASGQAMTLKHDNAGSTAANRIMTYTGGDVVVYRPLLIYSATDSRWMQMANA